jgi:hypothetical protein
MHQLADEHSETAITKSHLEQISTDTRVVFAVIAVRPLPIKSLSTTNISSVTRAQQQVHVSESEAPCPAE